MAIEKTAIAAPFRVPFRQDAGPATPGGFEAALTAVLGERPKSDVPPRVPQPKAPSDEAPAAHARAVRPINAPVARGAIILTPEILLPENAALAANAKAVTPGNPPVARGAIILTPDVPDASASTGGETEAAPAPALSPPAAAPSTGQAAARSAPVAPSGQTHAPAPCAFTADEEAMLFAAARSVKPPPTRVLPASASPLDARPSEVAATVNADPDSVLKTAAAQIGRRYASGGETPRQGFDCSGLTSYVYAKSGLELPRSSREQFRHGQAVRREELKKGDLVFFGKKGVNHVGVYLEDGKFIHAASTAGSVKVGSLDDPVWDKLYAGARRLF
jgi:cell wall-associated NlpC family hydrolase